MDEETLFCELCKLNFITKEELIEHDWSLLHHRKLDKEKGRDILHTCKLCKEDVFGLLAFTKHIHSEKHLNEVTKMKYSESQVAPSASSPIQQTSETSTTMQTPSETLPLPAAHFLPRARYFQSLENPLSSTPLLDSMVKSFQPKPWKPYRFTPQHKPYIPPRSNFRPRFQNPYRYVKPSHSQPYPNTPTHMNGSGINAVYPNPMSTNTNTSTNTNQTTTNIIYPNPPPLITTYTSIGKYSKQVSASNDYPISSSTTTFSDATSTNNTYANPTMNNYMPISPVLPTNNAFLTDRINFLKTKYPIPTSNISSNQHQTSKKKQDSSINTQHSDNFSNASSPISKKLKLERNQLIKKHESRMKSKKKAILKHNSSRKLNGHQHYTKSMSSDNNDSSNLSNSFNSSVDENNSSISIQGRKESFLRLKSNRQSVLKEPSRNNNTSQDNLNLNVQFVLKKGREIVNRYNKGINKGIVSNNHNSRKTPNLGELKSNLKRQTNSSSPIDFTPHFNEIRKISIPIVANQFSNSNNTRRKEGSSVESGGTKMLSEKAQILLQKTKPFRVELSALSPTTLSFAKRPKKGDHGPHWNNNPFDQVNFQDKHQKYIKKYVKGGSRDLNNGGKKSVDKNTTINTSKPVMSFSIGAINSVCSFSSPRSYNPLPSPSSIYENSNQQTSQTPTTQTISMSSQSVNSRSVTTDVDSNHSHKIKVGKSRFLYHDPLKSDPKHSEVVTDVNLPNNVATSLHTSQKVGHMLNESPNFIDSNGPVDMEKLVNELLSKSPGFEYLANENTKKKKKKKNKLSEGKKAKKAVNQGNLGKHETERILKRFELYQKARERYKENAVPGGNLKNSLGYQRSPTKTNDITKMKKRFRQPISTSSLDKPVEPSGSGEPTTHPAEVTTNAVNCETSKVVEDVGSESKEDAAYETNVEKRNEPTKVKKRFMQTNSSSSSNKLPVVSAEPSSHPKETSKDLRCDKSVDMEVVSGEDIQNEGSLPSTEKRMEAAKVKKRFRQTTSSCNFENLSSAASEELSDHNQESNENDLSCNTSKDIESISTEDDQGRSTGDELASLKEKFIRVKNRFRQSSASSESMAHQGVIVHNEQERKGEQKDATTSENVNEVISLDDDDDEADNHNADKQHSQNKEAVSEVSNNIEQQRNSLQIKNRFRRRTKSVTVNDNRNNSDKDVNVQAGQIDGLDIVVCTQIEDSQAKSGEDENRQTSDDASPDKKRTLKVKNRFKQTSTACNVGNLPSNDSVINNIEEVHTDKERSNNIAEKDKSKSTQLLRSLSESEVTQTTADTDSLQKLISNYVYSSDVENPPENDPPSSIPAAVITTEVVDILEKPSTEHSCEFKKNNGTYCDTVTTERFCGYHLRVLKAVELFISKKVASGPPKVSDAVSLIETSDDNIDTHDIDGECNVSDPFKALTPKRRLSENSNDSEVEGINSEPDKRIDLSTSRFHRKKCKAVCMQTSNSQIDLSVSPISKKIGKHPRFKYLKNLTSSQNEVHKTNLPPTVRKLLDKKHNGYTIGPNVRMHTNSQSEGENENINYERRKEKNDISNQLDKVTSNSKSTLSDADDSNCSESCSSEHVGDKNQESQISSLHDSDISDLSLLERLHKTNLKIHKDFNTTESPDPNVLQKLFSIQAPVFSKTLLPTITCNNESKFLFGLNDTADMLSDGNASTEKQLSIPTPTVSSVSSCNVTATRDDIIVTNKSLPVNVITSAMLSQTAVVSVYNQPLTSTVDVISMTATAIATTTKVMPVSVITTSPKAVLSVASEMSSPTTKSLPISVITKPSATTVQEVTINSFANVITMSSEAVTPLVTLAPLVTMIQSVTSTSSVTATPPVSVTPSVTDVASVTVTPFPPTAEITTTFLTQPVSINTKSVVDIITPDDRKELQSSVTVKPLDVTCPHPVIDVPLSVTNVVSTSNTTELPYLLNSEALVSTSLSVITEPISRQNAVESSAGTESLIYDIERNPEMSYIMPNNRINMKTINNINIPSDDFTKNENAFIDIVKKKKESMRRHTGKITEKEKLVLTVEDDITTTCYNVPVISSPIDSTDSLDAETVTTLFCFKRPIISNSLNKSLDKDSSTNNSTTHSNETTTSIIKSDCLPDVVIEPITGSLTSNGKSVSDDDTANTTNAMCVDLPYRNTETLNTSDVCSNENAAVYIKSERNSSSQNSITEKDISNTSNKSGTVCSKENSKSFRTPDLMEKVTLEMDCPEPSRILQSSLIELNENNSFVANKIVFQEEISCINQSDEMQFHSITSDVNSASRDDSNEDHMDANSTFDNYKSFESDDVGDPQIVTIKDCEVDSPVMIKSIHSMSQHDVDIDKTDDSINNSDIGENTISELEKELNKLQTDEDDALDKLSKANKSLERLKIEMGKLQDEISLHANNMQKLSAEKKKLRVTLQMWRSFREKSTQRTPRKFMNKEDTFSNKKIHRKSYSASSDASSDDNVPLSFAKDMKILENLSKDESVRMVKTIYVNDSCISSSKASSTSDNSSSDNNTESEYASGYDTAPTSPNKISKTTPTKDRNGLVNNSSCSIESIKKPVTRNSMSRCHGSNSKEGKQDNSRTLRERPNKSKKGK